MPEFYQSFKSYPAILPVIHIETPKQVFQNIETVRKYGCDGAFLIDMQGRWYSFLLDLYNRSSQKHPDFWLGVNCLSLRASEVFGIVKTEAPTVSGIWVDNAHIHEGRGDQPIADMISTKRLGSGWDGLYFGGVAFKYQKEVRDLSKAVQRAKEYMDVVVTSGKATGSSPDQSKIITMKEAIGSHPLGIASGLNAENAALFRDHANALMLSSSLLYPDSELFDPSKVSEFVKRVRE